MDILTQGLLGGVLAQSVSKNEEKKKATFVGIIAGLLADADILIQSSSDPLLNIEYHRHFTHSLLFIPLGAAIATLLLWPLLHRHLPLRRLYLFSLLGYSLSGVLDACTSYGTHLLWPFTDERVALNIISIIDPVFTVILLTTLLLGLIIKRRYVAHVGLVLCVSYMMLGFVQLQRAHTLATELAMNRGHNSGQHVVKPTLANLLLWRSIYIHDDRIYVDAIRVGLLGDKKIFEGTSVKRFKLQQDMPGLETASALYADIQRFIKFSDNFVAFDPGYEYVSGKKVLGDIRYSMLPASIRPLWGIVIDLEQPHLHADYRFFRDTSPQVRQTLANMVLGNCDVAVC